MGKYKKFLYFFIVVICFVFIPNVKAESIAIGDENSAFGISIGGENWENPNYFTVGANSERELKVYLYNYEGVSKPWTYLMVSGCAARGYAGASYITNNSHSPEYFDETQFIAYDTNPVVDCTTPDGYYGRVFYMQFRVGLYEDMDGTGEELKVSATLHLKNTISSSVRYYFYTWYLSSEDLLTQLKKDSELLKAYNEQLQQSIENTSEITSSITSSGNKINSAIGETNDLLEDSNEKQQEMINKQNETNQKLDANTDAVNEQTETLKDSDSSKATNEAGSFFSGFQTDTFGLTSIITAPINLITSITSSTCSPVGLPVPFVDNMTLNLPCIRGIYEQHFGSLLSIYQTITFGIVAYWVCIRIFALVKDFKNPDHDEIEVLDL